MTAREPGWSRPLSRTLTLKSGRRLTTLLDATDLLAEQFQTATRNDLLEYAIGLLLRAAETGTLADRRAATDRVALVQRLSAMA
jgi:hypothetical protein